MQLELQHLLTISDLENDMSDQEQRSSRAAQGSGRVVRGLTLFLPAVATVAGCASGPATSSATPPDAGPTPLTDASPASDGAADLDLPIARYMLDAAEIDLVDDAFVTLVGRCLHRFGETAPVPTAGSAPGLAERRYGLTNSAVAAVHGYHLGEPPSDEPPEAAGEVPEELLWGAATPAATIDGMPVPPDGCAGEATRTFGGDIGDPELVQRINIESVQDAMSDPRVVAAFADWSDCMSQRGFDYATPWDPPGEDWFAEPEPSAEEIAVATADVECKEATEVITVWHTVDSELQTAMLAENQAQLGQIEQDLRRRLDVARAVVDGATGGTND